MEKEKEITLNFILKEAPQKSKKKKLEFMQRAVLITLMLPFIWVTFSYVLAWCDKINTLEQLSVAVVSVPIATVISYAIQNCTRAKWFKDKTSKHKGDSIYGNTKTTARISSENCAASDSRYEEN